MNYIVRLPPESNPIHPSNLEIPDNPAPTLVLGDTTNLQVGNPNSSQRNSNAPSGVSASRRQRMQLRNTEPEILDLTGPSQQKPKCVGTGEELIDVNSEGDGFSKTPERSLDFEKSTSVERKEVLLTQLDRAPRHSPSTVDN